MKDISIWAILGVGFVGFIVGITLAPKQTIQTTSVQFRCDDCEYKKGDLYYRGWCDTISQMINLEKQKRDFYNDIENKTEELLNEQCPRWCQSKILK